MLLLDLISSIVVVIAKELPDVTRLKRLVEIAV